jgi:hypothetical protein
MPCTRKEVLKDADTDQPRAIGYTSLAVRDEIGSVASDRLEWH